MISLDTPAQRYPSPGCCIFCLKNPPEISLTNEHIIPLFLTGTGEIILEGGSCKKCNDRAGDTFERKASNADFLVPRLLLDLKRRNVKRKPPKSLPPVALRDGSDFTVGVDLDYDTILSRDLYPKNLSFITLARAGYLVGVPRTGDLTQYRVFIHALDMPTRAMSVGFRHDHDHTATALTIAKIGYAFAVAQRGLNGFDGSGIRSLINGTRGDTYNFIGSRDWTNSSTKELHRLSLVEEGGYLVALVKLFNSAKVPPYEVVVGKLPSPEPKSDDPQ